MPTRKPRSSFASKQMRVATLLRKEVDREETAGVIEALEAGLPVVRERHGFHSNEARAVERSLRLLTNKRSEQP